MRVLATFFFTAIAATGCVSSEPEVNVPDEPIGGGSMMAPIEEGPGVAPITLKAKCTPPPGPLDGGPARRFLGEFDVKMPAAKLRKEGESDLVIENGEYEIAIEQVSFDLFYDRAWPDADITVTLERTQVAGTRTVSISKKSPSSDVTTLAMAPTTKPGFSFGLKVNHRLGAGGQEDAALGFNSTLTLESTSLAAGDYNAFCTFTGTGGHVDFSN